MSLKKGKLIRGVQKTIIKYVERHCKVGHPTTDLVCERINTVLEGVLLGMERMTLLCPGVIPKVERTMKHAATNKT